MVELTVIAALLAKGVQKVVDAIRGIDRDNIAPKWCWPIVAMIIGIGGAHLAQIDLASIPLNGPAWVVRSVLGIVTAGLAAGWHEVDDLVSSKAKKVRADSRAYAPGEAV